MTLVSIGGLEGLKRRFEARGLEEAIKNRLSREAEAIAEEAAKAAPGRLGETIEIIDESDGAGASFSIGTSHRAARFVEFGTRHMRAQPFLLPAFRIRLPRIKHELTNTLRAWFAKR